jgi:serine/threonine-protein kinase
MGFCRRVAIKQLHPHLARDPAFVAMLLDEARLGCRITHPYLVDILDLVADHGELSLVIGYVHGLSLRALLRSGAEPVAVDVAASIVYDVLLGLHVAHEARDERGAILGVVHRDVSPHNILVGVDGIARLTDFGIAKAAWRAQSTGDGQLKGKLAYMAPEQLKKGKVDRRADLFSAAIVLWELLEGKRLFDTDEPGDLFLRGSGWQAPSLTRQGTAEGINDVVMRGLKTNPDDRFATAEEMAEALRRVCPPAPPSQTGGWVYAVGQKELDALEALWTRAQAPDASRGATAAWKVSADTQTELEATPGASAVSEPAPRARRFEARPLWIAAGIAATVIAAMGWVGMTGGPATQSNAAAQPTGPLELQGSAGPALVQSVASVPSIQSARPSTSLSSRVQAMIASPSRPKLPMPPAKGADAPAHSAASSLRKDPCNPPYTSDEVGVKVYKVECL